MQSAHVSGCCRRAFFCCKLSDQRCQLDAQAVAISLAVFAAVYFVVFGASVFYILKLMGLEAHSSLKDLITGFTLVGQNPAKIDLSQVFDNCSINA